MPFSRFWPRLRPRTAARNSARSARAALYERISTQAASRPGPPAIALARQRVTGEAGIVIDPLETGCRAYPDGIEVRAWVRLPRHVIPAPMLEPLESSTAALMTLPHETKRIFFLCTAYGIGLDDIAALLHLRRRQVRRAMLEVIAALDAQHR